MAGRVYLSAVGCREPMKPQPMLMSADTVYQTIRNAIDDQLVLDDELSTFELIGVIRMIEAELIAAAMEPEDSDDIEG